MSLQCQNLYDANKASDGLDTYCRLEGLDPLYMRSMWNEERKKLNMGKSNFLGRLFGKLSGRTENSEDVAAINRTEPSGLIEP